jgi:farnesyl diphosphate synthase
VGKDAHKATLVSLLGVAAARGRLGELEAQAIALLQPFGPAAETLREAARFVGQRRT